MPTVIIALMMITNYRTTTVKVEEVNKVTNEIIVIEEDGNEWSFFGDGFTEGEEIQVHFKNDHIIGAVEE